MLEKLKIVNDWWVIFWFVTGISFIVLAVIAAHNGNDIKAIADIAMCNACHARCEVKILQRKLELNSTTK